MRIVELLREASENLRLAGIGNYANEARWILMESCRLSAADIVAGGEISGDDVDRARELVRRRMKNEPLQYILGSAPFGELELAVTPDVLIPRPETEVLVDFAVQHLVPNGRFLDIGCGSGAIAILLAYRRRDARVTAVDKSIKALETAEKNALRHSLDSRMKFLESDLFSALQGEAFDFIAANLPYVTFDEYDELDDEVRLYEPRMALTAADDGAELMLRTIAELPEHLSPGGRCIFEMSPHQICRVSGALESAGFTAETIYDQYGKERFVSGVRR